MKGTRYEVAARGYFRFLKSRILAVFEDVFFVFMIFALVFFVLLAIQSVRVGLGL